MQHFLLSPEARTLSHALPDERDSPRVGHIQPACNYYFLGYLKRSDGLFGSPQRGHDKPAHFVLEGSMTGRKLLWLPQSHIGIRVYQPDRVVDMVEVDNQFIERALGVFNLPRDLRPLPHQP